LQFKFSWFEFNFSVIDKQKVTSRVNLQSEDFYGRMKKLYFTKKLTAVLGIALVIIAINAVISYRHTIGLIHYQHWLTQSLLTGEQLYSTKMAFNNTEIAKQGYLITGEQNYLDAYVAGVEETNTILQHLQSLTFNYSQALKYINLLNNQITTNFQIFAREIELKKNRSLEPSHQELISLGNSNPVNEIEQLIQNIASREQKLLLKRINESQINFQNSLITFSIATFGDVAGVGCLFVLLRSYISRLKLTEQRFQEQAALLDATVDGVLIQDMHLKIQYWNQGAERLYGWSAKEVVGKDTSYLLYQADSRQLEAALASVINYGSWQGELKQVRCDDREMIVESRWTLVRDDKGQPKSILTVNTNVTQQKQLEMQLMRSQRLESIGTLAGGIAHDLNNVLSPILMSVQLLQMKLRNSEHQQLLRTLENNVKRGASLVKQVLTFARGMETKRTVVDLKQVIAEIEQIITETFSKAIACEIELPTQLNHVCGDTTQIHQVLMNLVVNARDAMPDGGKLSISAKNAREGKYILITVTDTGMGIPENVRERIFEPFFTTKNIDKGTGLGLSTTLAIVKNHGGFVKVDSEVNKGTIFQIFLPAMETYEPVKNEPEIGFIMGSGELILVVDDEAPIREITQSTLEACNYRVLTASDGVEAVTIYSKHQDEISLVLLDMMMPAMDGAIAIRTLQKINPQVKIIAISGLLSSHKVSCPQKMGVEAFISKPCTAKELLQTISSLGSRE
jgi:two-component system, cell cycle sensor histidine kinase and response regulator CckA